MYIVGYTFSELNDYKNALEYQSKALEMHSRYSK